MRIRFLVPLFLLICIGVVGSDDYPDIEIADSNEPRSRIIMVDGHMYFESGVGKNITFKTNGKGRIRVGDTDITELPNAESTKLSNESKPVLDEISAFVGFLESGEDHLRAGDVLLRIGQLTIMTNAMQNMTSWKRDRDVREFRRRGTIVKLQKQLASIQALLTKDGCRDMPCQAGGQCVPSYGGKFVCICPMHRTGDKCEFDVNECEIYNGTHAGCQNNATCENTNGSFM
ncbi:hypothetical protein WR25_22784 [Diploscapter pachys]|uniref:EGF-like domain-containing protein n=1 Tax=Diploscapter pachys TaxID=2018661 RepID=A0A2A2JJH6_9BILA|nr:hypothetical protein WR25_22784 [Diploscapter pachys]